MSSKECLDLNFIATATSLDCLTPQYIASMHICKLQDKSAVFCQHSMAICTQEVCAEHTFLGMQCT